jgi:hypothetical protein
MNSSDAARRLLEALFVMKQSNEIIELFGVCQRAELSLYAGLSTLQLLGSVGLVDPVRLRLTLTGLGVAASLVRGSVAAEVQFEQLWSRAA